MKEELFIDTWGWLVIHNKCSWNGVKPKIYTLLINKLPAGKLSS